MESINVNLKPCMCGYTISFASPGTHYAGCPAIPVLIPCPIPRSVTFTVTLGKCDCHPKRLECRTTCPGRPIRVSCSISGTWNDSEVFDIEPVPDLWGANANLRAIARERWALVKALVLGHGAPDVLSLAGRMGILDLYTQRDAVFAALAAMARAEDVLRSRVRDLAGAGLTDVQLTEVRMRTAVGASEAGLSAYVEHLIEQVGVL